MKENMKAVPALLLALASISVNAQDLPEVTDSGLGYKSPQAAQEALEAKPGVTRREENNWVVLSDPNDNSIWSIAQPGNPAFPAAVRRHFVERDKSVYIEMGIMCGASKTDCDNMVRLFQEGNERMREQFRK